MSRKIFISLGITALMIAFMGLIDWLSIFFIGKIIVSIIMILVVFAFVYSNVTVNSKEKREDDERD